MGNARTERNKARRRSERESAVLEAELRMLLDPLPDGPVVRGRPFRETFVDVWIPCGGRHVSRHPVR